MEFGIIQTRVIDFRDTGAFCDLRRRITNTLVSVFEISENPSLSLVYSFFDSVRPKFRRWTFSIIQTRWYRFRDTGEGALSLSATCGGVLLSFLYIDLYILSLIRAPKIQKMDVYYSNMLGSFDFRGLLLSFLYIFTCIFFLFSVPVKSGAKIWITKTESPGNKCLGARICAASINVQTRDELVLMIVGQKPRVLVYRTEKEMESRDGENPRGDKSRDIIFRETLKR